jgi:imidazolonepropionase-like amidohydrolase
MGATIGLSGGDLFERVAEVDRLVGEIESGRRYRESQVEYRHELEEWQKKIDEQQKELEKNAKKAQKDREKEQSDAKEKGKEFKEKPYKEDKRPNAPAPNPQDEAMARVAHGEMPLIVELQRAAELRALLDGTRKMPRLRLVLAGAREAAPFAAELAERGIPVIVLPAPQAAWGAGREHELALAATLQQAGVEVLIGSGGERTYTRDLPQLAAIAVGNGLDPQAAFSALTLGAARTLDVGDRLGSVERGKQADLLVLDGDPLQTRTRVQFVIARGEVVVEP